MINPTNIILPILLIGILILSIINFFGLIFLSKFSFNGKVIGKVTTVSGINQTQLNFTKVTIILLWLQIFLSIFASIISMTN